MSRRPKAPLAQTEIDAWMSQRRSDALPVVEIYMPSDMRVKPLALIHCLTAFIRREQLWRIREVVRRSKRPDIKTQSDERNHRPAVAKRRKDGFKHRYHGDPDYRARVIAERIEYFKNNKQRQYDRIKARKPITIERDREYIRTWQRNKRQTDPQYNLGNRLRSRLWHAVVAQGGSKAFKTMEMVGCTLPELRTHLERQFTDGMNWDGILSGRIHLDHIRPCASFDLTDPGEQRKCFHYTNLQPLWEKDNLSKGDTFSFSPAAG